MNREIPMLLIGMVFGGLIGFLIAAGYGVTLDGHDHSDHGSDHGSVSGDDFSFHAHDDILQVGADTAPTVSIQLHAEPGGGWNIEVLTENFTFSPEHVSQEHVEGEGHAHAYVNGIKVARLYGPWMQVPAVRSGDVVAITLYSNDHKALAVGLKSITTSVTIP